MEDTLKTFQFAAFIELESYSHDEAIDLFFFKLKNGFITKDDIYIAEIISCIQGHNCSNRKAPGGAPLLGRTRVPVGA